MRRTAILAASIALSLSVAGCETSDMMDSMSETIHNFNPFGTNKKKLTGSRQAVFPDGVPGVQQGVPPELMPGATPDATAAVEPKVEEKPKAAPKRTRTAVQRERPPQRPKIRPQPAERAPQQTASPAQAPNSSAWDAVPAAPRAPAARPAQSAPAGGQQGWPAQGASQPVPTIWPEPPQTGSFSR